MTEYLNTSYLSNNYTGYSTGSTTSANDNYADTNIVFAENTSETEEINGNAQDELDNVLASNERETKYGVTWNELTAKQKMTVMADMVKCCFRSADTTTPETGIQQTQYDGYTVTSITLYDGKTYEQLSDEEKESFDEWKEKSTIIMSFSEMDCPFEITTETRYNFE